MTLSISDQRARQCPVIAEEPPPGKSPYDYADAFEVTLAEGDGRTAEQILRAGLQGAPQALRSTIVAVHRHVLRFRLGPLSSPSHVLGWQLMGSEPDVARLEISGSVIEAALVARRVGDRTARLTTFVVFRQPTVARLIFPFVAPVHRRVAAYLMERAARPAE
jgi:hypothetical protein